MQTTVVENIRGYFNENGEIYLYLEDIAYGLEFTNVKFTFLGEQVTVNKERVLTYLNNFGKYYDKIRSEYISEEIYYKLADLADKNDRVEDFKKMIKNEVIPKIRRKWAFTVENQDTDELILAKAQLISKNMIEKLEKKVKKLENYKDNEILMFDSEEEYKTFLNVNKQFFSMKQIAEEFNMEEDKLRIILEEKGLILSFKPNLILGRKIFGKNFVTKKIFKIKNIADKKEYFWTIEGKEEIKRLLKKI